jgi:hypothetical protein
LAAQRESIGVGEARAVDDDLGVHCADQEVILVLGSHFSGMRQAEEIELIVARPEVVLTGERRFDSLSGSRCACGRKKLRELHGVPSARCVIGRRWLEAD